MSFTKDAWAGKRIRIIFILLFILYIVYLSYLLFFSRDYGRTPGSRSYNLVPFATIRKYLYASGNADIALTNLMGNIGAFIPMGFLLPLAFKKFSGFLGTALTILLATAAVETVQYITGVGIWDVDDIILNMAGGIIGLAASRLVRRP
ncbi:MAG: VanZ family protein [Clostridiales bacterium]|jgi:glycopeptide antibiotics resistance protein|nr:VanZ family protein [Eubacteriales bacterium]MDH7567008.1 VanZ family protein [Clostridiales bacterium]